MKKIVFLLALSILLSGFDTGQKAGVSHPDPMVTFLKEYLDIKYNGARFNTFIYVAAKRQRLYLISNDTITKTFIISTGEKGIGNLSGSNQTPEGLHKIAEKVGDNLPINTVIKSKIATNEQALPILEPKSNNRDLI